jgi:hypothetical protein
MKLCKSLNIHKSQQYSSELSFLTLFSDCSVTSLICKQASDTPHITSPFHLANWYTEILTDYTNLAVVTKECCEIRP